MFETLLQPYRERIGAVPPEKLAEFRAADKDLKDRNDIQGTLLNGLGAAQRRARRGTAQAEQLAERVRLVTAQKKFVQGAQQLDTDHRELTYLLGQARELVASTAPEGADGPKAMVAELESKLAAVALRQRTLATERQQAALARAQASTRGLALPPADAPFVNGRDTPVTLAVQQTKLLEMATLKDAVQAAIAPAGDRPTLAPTALATLRKQHEATAVALAAAARLVAVYTLGLDCSALNARLAAQKLALERAVAAPSPVAAHAALGAEALADFTALPTDVDALAKTARKRTESLAIANRRTAEAANNERLRDEALDRWVTGRVDASTPPFVVTTLAKPLRPGQTIGQAFIALRGRGSLKDLGAAIAERARLAGAMPEGDEKKAALAQALALADALQALGGAKMNQIVQDYFLLTRGNELKVRASDESDSDFLARTNSAKGDFNSPANLGKYTYHVTALANILRKIGSGISATGLSPSQGGLSGGSCDLALVTKKFHGTDIKKASIVNSQDKVASSSNRQGAMKVYIKQREDASDALMATPEPEGANRAKAAQESTVMLRFPLRAEYIGKFDKDPIHLTANLALLDGTPVPPDDIEMLVHHKWMPITDNGFQAAYRQMMGIVTPEPVAPTGS